MGGLSSGSREAGDEGDQEHHESLDSLIESSGALTDAKDVVDDHQGQENQEHDRAGDDKLWIPGVLGDGVKVARKESKAGDYDSPERLQDLDNRECEFFEFEDFEIGGENGCDSSEPARNAFHSQCKLIDEPRGSVDETEYPSKVLPEDDKSYC